MAKTRKLSRKEKRETRNFYLYIMPWLISFLVLTVYPMFRSLTLCFTDSDFSGRGLFVGFKNFNTAFFTDPLFFKVFENTLWYVVLFVPASLILSFFIGWLLSRNVRALGFFRTVFYLPYITTGVAVIMLWGWIFNSDYGFINYLLSLAGIQGPRWLTDKNIAMVSIVIMSLWSIGNGILIMLAGIQDIPETYYESARLDGASTLRQVFKITIPLCTPTIFFNLVIGTIIAFQIFSQPYILTRGGPVDSTRTVAMYLFSNAFEYGKMGFAATIAWCLFIVIMTITLILQATSKKWVFYDN
ncbi:MAG: sugar ABC transporter permease [Bacillota bacterium]